MATAMNRRYVYAHQNPHKTISIVNYDADNYVLNNFLAMFDLWESKGERKQSIDKQYSEVWFECSSDMWDILHTETFRQSLKRMGVDLVFKYPY